MYKSEVKHQHDICHGQGYATKYYFGEFPAGMLQFAVMTAEGFTVIVSVSEFTKDRGHKAEGKS